MPWTPKEVDSHKKGLSSDEKKQWCSMANAILRDCLKEGGKESECAGKAIRIANEKYKTVKLGSTTGGRKHVDHREV